MTAEKSAPDFWDDSFWRDSFHLCAFIAYAEIAAETGQMPPDSELTRRRAYRIYETRKRKEDNKQIDPPEQPL